MLRDLPPGVADGHPLLTWDDRIAAHRAAASDWPLLRECLADQSFTAAPADPADPVRVARVGGRQDALLRAPELRAYQQASVATWQACGRRGIVVLPTGAGKTRVALAAIASLQVPAIVLVPTRALLDQWTAQLLDHGAAAVGQLGDTHRTVRPLTVATYQSAWRHAAGLGDRFGLVIADEAHHAGGLLRPEILEMSLAPFRLGLTALAPSASPGSRHADLLGPVVFRLRVRDLAGTSLAPMTLVGIGLDMTPRERARWLGLAGCYRAELARHAIDIAGRPFGEIARRLARTDDGRRALAARAAARSLASFTTTKSLVLASILARHATERILVFTRDNRAAHAIASEHLVPAVTCEMRPRERREVLAAFARGELRTLVSARVLDEGLDVPEAAVAVIVGASGSGRQHVQRVGRILRPSEGKRAIVYDLFQLEAGEAHLASARRAVLAG